MPKKQEKSLQKRHFFGYIDFEKLIFEEVHIMEENMFLPLKDKRRCFNAIKSMKYGIENEIESLQKHEYIGRRYIEIRYIEKR